MRKKIKYIMTILSAAALLAGCGGQKENHMVSKEGFFFDTIISISIASENGEEVLSDSFALCETYEKIFSRTRENSELYQVNHRTTDSVQVSQELYEVISCAKEYYEKSQGRFDASVAPLSDLWDFKSENPRVPDAGEIRAAAEKVDFSSVILGENHKITFTSQETMLDLGALAKGYIADSLKEFLISQGVKSGYMNLGGNVLTIGTKPDGSPWKIGVQKPFGGRNEILGYVDAEDKSVVSSGIYERYFEQDETLYFHVLNPSTGYPVETELSQVTVISDSSLTGDAMSTSCLLMGYEKGRELVEAEDGAEAVFVFRDGSIKATKEELLCR